MNKNRCSIDVILTELDYRKSKFKQRCVLCIQ